jgi:cytoskeletal protein CcmA (bactofilin family)
MADSYNVASEPASVLGTTLRFKGELSASEALVINGQVEGIIGPAPKVTIGPEAHVKASVNADVIIVEGRVEGDLKAQVSIAIRPRANVRGNLESPLVNIAEGAAFNGGVTMEPARTDSKAAPARAADTRPSRTGTAD